jgi:hypothetical protein
MGVMTTASLSKVLLHACPRCHGDLILDLEDGQYGCLQCGRELPLARLEALATIDTVLAAAMTPRRHALTPVAVAEMEVHNDAA